MFDFNISSMTREGIWFCTFFYFLILCLFWGKSTQVIPDSKAKKKNYIFLWVLVLIFALLSWTNGDWFHYLAMVSSFSGIGGDLGGLEMFYQYLILFTNGNYLAFRIVVWGLALILLTNSFSKLEIDTTISVFFLFAVFIDYFDYSRSALGIAVFFWGYSIYLTKHNRLIRIAGLAICLCSMYFHRSTMVLPLLGFVSLIPLRRRYLLVVIGLLALSFFSLKDIFVSTLDSFLSSEDEGLAYRANLYLNLERGQMITGNFIGMVTSSWKYSVFYVLFAYSTNIIYKNNLYDKLPVHIRTIYNFSFALVVFSTMMYMFNIGHLAFYYRYLMMLYAPLTIVVVYLFQNNHITRYQFKNLLLYSAGIVMFTFLYRSAIGA